MEAHQWARDRTLTYTGGSQVPWAETVLVGRQALYLAGDPRERAAAEAALVRLEGAAARRGRAARRRAAAALAGFHSACTRWRSATGARSSPRGGGGRGPAARSTSAPWRRRALPAPR
ncbi:MAG: hypothetical protein R3F59_12770 [Myxococcota bacterium]